MKLVRDRERAVATDDDKRLEPHLLEVLQTEIGVVDGATRRVDGVRERVAAIRRAEHRATEAEDAGDVAGRQRARFLRVDEAVEAVLEADALDAVGVRGLDDRANHGVQSRRVTAAGQDTNTFWGRHAM